MTYMAGLMPDIDAKLTSSHTRADQINDLLSKMHALHQRDQVFMQHAMANLSATFSASQTKVTDESRKAMAIFAEQHRVSIMPTRVCPPC